MTRIKICGITSLEDARAAISYGADALGFIFVPGSPRYLLAEQATWKLVLALPPFVSKVAVYRALEDAEANPMDRLFDTVQFYAKRPDTPITGERIHVHAFRVRDECSLGEIARSGTEAHALLLDAYSPNMLGGSGDTFDWRLAQAARQRFTRPLILAGGLTPSNVGAAVAAVRPYAVDVSSGVEAEPGRKDHHKLRAFIQAVREADAGGPSTEHAPVASFAWSCALTARRRGTL